MYVLGAIVVRGCCEFLEIDLFYDLKRLCISLDVFICALFGYSINIRIYLVYDEVFRSSPEKWSILYNKTNEISNFGNSTQNFEEYFANWKRQLTNGGSVYAWRV
jgi:hypothetical protein